MTRGQTEYRLLKAAAEEGVPIPRLHLMGDDSLDAPFFLMERVEGETIPRRLLPIISRCRGRLPDHESNRSHQERTGLLESEGDPETS